MARVAEKTPVYLEIGQKRTIACAVDWPGWCRGGRDEDAALAALLAYGPRYSQALRATGLGFAAPADLRDLEVVERLTGNATTDYGVPAMTPAADRQPVDDASLARLIALLRAYWAAFDAAVEAVEGKELRKGPRGGGRELEAIIRHVMEAEGGYLGALGVKVSLDDATGLAAAQAEMRQAVIDGLGAAARGETPAVGPRGGARWAPRYFVRRVAYHVLDHAWEIEDRRE
jgi:hypothetical protein